MTSQILRYISLLLFLVGMAIPSSADDRMKHSGTIFAIEDGGASFILAEVGPWRPGGALVTYRTITITSKTQFAIVARAEAAPTGFPGDFVELEIERHGLYMNDFVTVDCQHRGNRLLALKITVTDVPFPETGIGSLR